MPKDWTGNKNSIFKTIGASNHADHERQEEDYYATEPAATDWLCKIETFSNPILEPACGEGHISRQLIAHGYEVVSRDIVNRGYGEQADFLFFNNETWPGDIITNPPVRVWVSRSRLKCAMNGDFASIGSSATAYAWFIWQKGFKGCPSILWFN